MSLYPFAGAHAVQSAAFALEWPVELSDDDIRRMRGMHHELKGALPQLSELQTFKILMGGQPGAGTTSAVPGGFVLSRQGAAGPAKVLEIQRNRMVAQVNDYTRWAPVWNEVKSWFDIFAPVLGQRQIAIVGLQYNDVFHWRADPSSLDLRQVFKVGSPLLPSNVFDLPGLWHSHHGYFLDLDDPIRYKLLENVNVNIIEELGQRSIVISSVHKAHVNVWGWEKLAQNVDSLMDALHARNKKNLEALLSEEAAAKISLFKGIK